MDSFAILKKTYPEKKRGFVSFDVTMATQEVLPRYILESLHGFR